MTTETRNHYAEILINGYKNGIFKYIWSKSSCSMAIDDARKELIPELQNDEFQEYAFNIMKLVIALAKNTNINNEENNDDLETANIIFKQEFDLKNHIYIKNNSKMECFKFLEYEIMSHRNIDNPVKLEANSAILKIVTEIEDNEKSHSFEISRRDLEDIINGLIELKEKMDIIINQEEIT